MGLFDVQALISKVAWGHLWIELAVMKDSFYGKKGTKKGKCSAYLANAGGNT